MYLRQRRGIAASGLLIIGGMTAALSSGCGSSSSSSTARIRGADFSVNGGTTGVLVNSTAVGGDLTYGQTSSYNYVGQGVSTFSYTSSVSFRLARPQALSFRRTRSFSSTTALITLPT